MESLPKMEVSKLEAAVYAASGAAAGMLISPVWCSIIIVSLTAIVASRRFLGGSK